MATAPLLLPLIAVALLLLPSTRAELWFPVAVAVLFLPTAMARECRPELAAVAVPLFTTSWPPAEMLILDAGCRAPNPLAPRVPLRSVPRLRRRRETLLERRHDRYG